MVWDSVRSERQRSREAAILPEHIQPAWGTRAPVAEVGSLISGGYGAAQRLTASARHWSGSAG